jgi:hypothetical protein
MGPAGRMDGRTKATLEAIERFNQAFGRHDVDDVMEAMSDDCVFENTCPPDERRGRQARRCGGSERFLLLRCGSNEETRPATVHPVAHRWWMMANRAIGDRRLRSDSKGPKTSAVKGRVRQATLQPGVGEHPPQPDSTASTCCS